MAERPATSSARKPEVLSELALWDEGGLNVTVDMLRARPRQNFKAMPVRGARARHEKKAELVGDARALRCDVDGKGARGDLQIPIRKSTTSTWPPFEVTDLMPFGRHRGKPDQTLLEQEREHVG